jgi:hypothetical protein
MSDDLREAVARAIFHAKYPTGTTWEQWAKKVEKRGGFDGRDWSRALADAALTEARPWIERETREADKQALFTVRAVNAANFAPDRLNFEAYDRAVLDCCEAIDAAAIRGEPT